MNKKTITTTDIMKIMGVGGHQARLIKKECENFIVNECGEKKPWRETLEGKMVPKNKIPLKLFEKCFPSYSQTKNIKKDTSASTKQ